MKNQQAGPTTSDASGEASEQASGHQAVPEITEVFKSTGSATDLKDQQVIQDLKKRDREVRTHEAAHLAAAEPYANGGPRYTYKRGSDGRQYAVGGEVKIDTREVPNDPEATLQKARIIRRAANAPAKPSAQDRAVASRATAMASEAMRALIELKRNDARASHKTPEARGSESADSTSPASDAASESDLQEGKPAKPANGAFLHSYRSYFRAYDGQ